MTSRRPPLLPVALLCALLAGCAHHGHMATAPAPPADWRQVATADDRARLRRWRQAWVEATARVRAAGAATAIADAGLYDPDHARPDAALPPGRYRCTTVKLGAGTRGIVTFPPGECRVVRERSATMLYRAAGLQRPVGRLYAEGPNRAIFLGTLVLGDENRPLGYGMDARRDLAGYVERIGERRWRLVLPYPRFESTLDVIELTPTG